MRQIVLDTETTGLDPAEGHRIVEIGAVEMDNHILTGKVFHQYINPQRDVTSEAENIHGLSADFLRKHPTFDEIATPFLKFLSDSSLIIHNANFDMRFLNAELDKAGAPRLEMERVIDTLQLARRKFPGSPASLDALCRRFSINNTTRVKHGALLDSELLAEVYLELIGGRQPGLQFTSNAIARKNEGVSTRWTPGKRPWKLTDRTTEEETLAHQALINDIGSKAIWTKRLC